MNSDDPSAAGERSSPAEPLSHELVLDIVANAIQDTVYVFDPETGRPLFWNAALGKVLGRSDAEIAEMIAASESFYPPEDLARLRRTTEKVLAEGQAEVEASIRTTDGRLVPFAYQAVRVEGREGRPAICVVGRDISAKREAERALAESEAQFRLIAEQSLLGLAVIQDGRIKFVNQEVANANGYSVEEMLAWQPSDLGKPIHPDDRAFALEQARKKQAGDPGAKTHYSYRVVRPGGEVRWVDQYSRTVEYGGRPADLVCIVDITQSRLAEDERMNLQQQLQQSQKMEAVGRLAGGVAHDMNNILAGILMITEVVQMKQDLDATTRAQVGEIGTLCKRGRKLTGDLLGFARKGKHQRVLISVAELLQQVVPLVERTIPKSIALRLEVDSQVSQVEGDPDQLRSVLLNLCLNGVDAMPEGGDLAILARIRILGEGELAAFPELSTGAYVEFQICDTGFGMDARTIERATEPFFTTKPANKGTGLGLSMAYGVAKNHDGALLIESVPGEGTTVSVLLRDASGLSRQAPVEEPGELSSRDRREGRVLLVDDEEPIRLTGERMLKVWGFETLLAGNGEEAIAVCRAHQGEFAAVLLDLAMPVMDGETACRILHEEFPDLKILLMSGFAVNGLPEDLLEQGVVQFLQKPFSAEELLQALDSLTGMTSSNGSSR